MKVLHISYANSGGAGIAALRLHAALLKQDIKSKYLCLVRYNTFVPHVYEFQPQQKPFYESIQFKYGFKELNSIKNLNSIKGKVGEFEIFTFPETDYALHEHPLVRKADIIHLHWVADFLDYPSFFNKIKKPIIWTFHDANPFLGGFHLEEDVTTNEEQFGSIEKILREKKESVISKLTNIFVVTPSKWLGKRSQLSNSFSNKKHFCIPNGIDKDIFKPYDSQIASKIWGGETDTLKLLFVSQSLKSKNKGFDLLIEALKKINLDNVEIWAIGKPGNMKGITNIPNIKYLGAIGDETLMALAYSAADAFIIPSRNENLPNVMLEAMACGTPIIGFNIGGIAEVVKTGKNGILAESVSADCLADAINKFIDRKYSFNRNSIREFAVEHFSAELQAANYVSLYQEVLNIKNNEIKQKGKANLKK